MYVTIKYMYIIITLFMNCGGVCVCVCVLVPGGYSYMCTLLKLQHCMCCVYTMYKCVCVYVLYGLLSESFVVDVLSDKSRETHLSFTREVCVCVCVCVCMCGRS